MGRNKSGTEKTEDIRGFVPLIKYYSDQKEHDGWSMWQKLEIIYIYIYIYGFGFKRSKGTTQKYRRRWHSNININLTEMRWDDVHWIHQYRDRQKPGGGGGVHKMLEITLLVEKLILIVRRVFLLFGYPD